MNAIILNAGLGSRLLPITNDIPKCMIEICGKCIIEHQIDTLREQGIATIVVVVGYLKEKIMVLKRDDIIFIENTVYNKTNSSYSLWLAREHLKNQEFLYLNGDLFFHKEILRILLADKYPNAIIVQEGNGGRDDSFKAEMEGNYILKMEKQKTGQQRCIEVPGPVKLSKDGAAILFQALDVQIQQGNLNRWVYTMLSEIAPVIGLAGVYINDLPWVEIDDMEDLYHAQSIFGHCESKKRDCI